MALVVKLTLILHQLGHMDRGIAARKIERGLPPRLPKVIKKLMRSTGISISAGPQIKVMGIQLLGQTLAKRQGTIRETANCTSLLTGSRLLPIK